MLKKYLIPLIFILSIVLTSCGPAATTAPAAPEATTAPEATKAPAAEPTKAPEAEATKAPEATAAPASKYSEAPMLDDLVKSGKLPPVDKRLPADVFTVGPGVYLTTEQLPDWTPGVYGGTLRAAHAVANWAPDIFVAMNEPLQDAA